MLRLDPGCVTEKPQAGWGSAPSVQMGQQKVTMCLSISVASLSVWSCYGYVLSIAAPVCDNLEPLGCQL